MGNSNPQAAIFNEPVSCKGSYSPFYGYHQLRERQVIKRYHLQQSEKEAFENMVENYRKIGFSQLIKIQSINAIRSDSQGSIYELQFPYYSTNFEDYLLKRERLFGAQESLKLILTLLEILQVFQHTPFLFTALQPSKILLKDNSLQYSVGIDSLMNPHFLKKTNQEEKQQKNRFQSPQKSKNNEKIDMTKSAIYSIGKMALWAMTFNDFDQKAPQIIAFQLRQQHSLQFCTFLESMLLQSAYDRIDLSLCLDNGYQLQEKIEILEEKFQKREFLKGYNCIQYDRFLTNNVSFHAKNKWKKIV